MLFCRALRTCGRFHEKEFGDGTQHERRKERKCADNKDRCQPEDPELKCVGAQGANRHGVKGLRATDPATAIRKMIGG